jgi:peptidoglycan/xylan/chitin deacetylase (PgdA/CDA1 family)
LSHAVEAKAALKKAVKGGAAVLGTLLPSAGDSRILTYHSIGSRSHEMNVDPGLFRDQMKWLTTQFDVIALSEAARGAPGVALTFDDGYRDNLVNAAPVLTDLGLSATVFMVAGRGGGFIGSEMAEEDRLMTWDEVRAIESAGFTIGAHTMTHPRLATLCEADQREEISGSKRRIEGALGHGVEEFAYPYGSALDFDATSVRLVGEAGFVCAVSNRYGVNAPGADRFRLRRIWIDASDTLTTFQGKVTGRLDLLSLLDSLPANYARRGLNRLLGV